jgi:AraC family cel operon transcriptional repressor
MLRSDVAQGLAARHPGETAGRLFWAGGADPEVLHLGGGRMDRLLDAARVLEAPTRGLSRIEEFLLALVNRVFAGPDRLQGSAPRWLVAACEAARAEPVFRAGAAGLVAAAGRSHAHVCRAMKAHLGTTPSAYVNAVRMDRAAELLAGTDMAVGDIAAHLGIENPGHFYRLFGARHGVSPRRYRHAMRRDPFAPG